MREIREKTSSDKRDEMKRDRDEQREMKMRRDNNEKRERQYQSRTGLRGELISEIQFQTGPRGN